MTKKVIIESMIVLALLSCTGNRSHRQTAETTDSAVDVPEAITLESNKRFLLVGTYTINSCSKGIYLYRFDTETGKADSVGMTEVNNPSYLTLSPDEKRIYSVGENDEKNSAVYAFLFDKAAGMLTQINAQTTQGAGPCYIAIDRRGKNVHTANYSSGTISSFQVREDGSLTPLVALLSFEGSGPDSLRQEKPHLHSVRYTPDGKYLLAADLGSDKLYRFSVNGTPFDGQPEIRSDSREDFVTSPGTGPRHFDFHPQGDYLYLLGELSGEVTAYGYRDGNLTFLQTVAADTTGARGSADIHVSPDGRFLYASHRLQADGISIFSIDPENGLLTKVGYQLTAAHPRNFVITPNGKFLLVASRDDNKIQVFEIDPKTGLLTDTHQDILIGKPVCLVFAAL